MTFNYTKIGGFSLNLQNGLMEAFLGAYFLFEVINFKSV